VGESAVTVHCVMWWGVSIEGHIGGRKKSFVIVKLSITILRSVMPNRYEARFY